MLCSIYRSHLLINNKAQNRQGNGAYCGRHCNYAITQDNKKILSKQIAAIRVDAIFCYRFKCQQQTRHALGIQWWRRVFKWTSGGNTAAEKTMGLMRGVVSILLMSFPLFCFENRTRTMSYEFFWSILRILISNTHNWTNRGKKRNVTINYFCNADTSCILWLAVDN